MPRVHAQIDHSSLSEVDIRALCGEWRREQQNMVAFLQPTTGSKIGLLIAYDGIHEPFADAAF